MERRKDLDSVKGGEESAGLLDLACALAHHTLKGKRERARARERERACLLRVQIQICYAYKYKFVTRANNSRGSRTHDVRAYHGLRS